MSTHLQLGNRAFRERRHAASIQHYLRALSDAPALSRFIAGNAALARRRLAEERCTPDGRQASVAVCCADLTCAAAARAYALGELYATFAETQIIGPLFAASGTTVWEPVRDHPLVARTFVAEDGDDFVAKALQFVVAEPRDVVHLSRPTAATVFLGALYAAIWGSRVLVDLDVDELALAGRGHLPASAAAPLPAFGSKDTEEGLVATRGLLTAFDGITVANAALAERHGGALVQFARAAPAPAPANRDAVRQRLGIARQARVVLTCSGNDDGLLETSAALAALSRRDLVLVVLGALPPADVQAQLAERGGVDCRYLGLRPFATIAEVYAAADAFVLLHDPARTAARQLPMSVGDALRAGLRPLLRVAPDTLGADLSNAVHLVTPKSLPAALREALGRGVAAPPSLPSLDVAANAAVLKQACDAAATTPSPVLREWLQRFPSKPMTDLRPLWAANPAAGETAEPVALAPGMAGAHESPKAQAAPAARPPARMPLVPRGSLASSRSPAPLRPSKPVDLRGGGSGLLLEVASQCLGRLADAALAVRILPVVQAFAALHGRDDVVTFESGLPAPLAPALIADPGSVAPRDLLPNELALVDAWFTTDTTLRLRVEPRGEGAAAKAAGALRLCQYDIGADKVQVEADIQLASEGPAFVDVSLANPYNALLMLAVRADGAIGGASLLPYPSLCRGGAHHAELWSIGSAGDYLSRLRQVSAGLACEWIVAADAAPAIGRLEIDLTGANGNEKIFTAAAKEWLSAVMGLQAMTPRAPLSRGVAAAEHLHAGCALPAPRRPARSRGTLSLSLAANSLPTISALVSRRLAPPEGCVVGSFASADFVSGRPGWLVSLPPMGAVLAGLQCGHRPLPYPLLADAAADTASPAPAAVAFPLAVRFDDPPSLREPDFLQPVASDDPRPLLHRTLSAGERRQASVSLLLCDGEDPALVASLVDSLATQTLAGAIDVVFAMPPAALAGTWETLLESRFPGRVQRAEVRAGARRSERLNAAAKLARGRRLLVAESGVVLHDPRALETLYTMLADGRFATAACVMLREVAFKKGTEVRFFSGGFFPSALSFLGRPQLEFEEAYTAVVLPDATYPVCANSLRLALVDAQAWSDVGGLDAVTFPAHRADLDFGLRTLAAGYGHLCTSLVTASDMRDGTAEEHADVHAAALLPWTRWQQVFDSVTTLRRLGA
jgi:hypothetical protein